MKQCPLQTEFVQKQNSTLSKQNRCQYPLQTTSLPPTHPKKPKVCIVCNPDEAMPSSKSKHLCQTWLTFLLLKTHFYVLNQFN